MTSGFGPLTNYSNDIQTKGKSYEQKYNINWKFASFIG